MFLSDFTDPVQCTKKYCSMMFYDFDLLLVQISTALTKIYVLKKASDILHHLLKKPVCQQWVANIFPVVE